MSVQMYQVYRRSITMSIQINCFYSKSVIMFVQIYRRSVKTFVRYTVSDFQLQQKFSKVVGFLMNPTPSEDQGNHSGYWSYP